MSRVAGGSGSLIVD